MTDQPFGYVTRAWTDEHGQRWATVQIGPLPWYVRWRLLGFWHWCKEPLT